MEAVAHSPSFAKKVGVPQSVGKDFSNADKGKSFKRGGDMAGKMSPKMMAMTAKKKDGMHKMPDGKMMKDSAMKHGGMAMVMKDGKKVPAFAADGEGKMKHGGVAKKMMGGGMSYAKGGLAMRGEGIAKKGFAKGGMADNSGQSQGDTLSRPTKTIPGEKVNVRGVGAARSRTAMIY